MLITALILFCAGLLLALGSALFVKIQGIDPFGVPQIAKVIENKKLPLSDILASSPDSNYMKKLSKKEYLRVAVTSFSGNVEIYSTDGDTYVELVNANTANLKVEVVGETLAVEEKQAVGFMGIYIDKDGFSFKGLRQLFGSGNSANTGKTLKIYLSDQIQVDQIDIFSAIGDIVVDGVKTEKMNITADYGNVIVEDLTAVAGKLDIKGNVNDVTLIDMQNIAATVSVKIGDIEASVSSVDGGSTTVLETWLGNVSVETTEPTTNYKLTLSTSLGEVSRNGESSGKELSSSSTTTNRITSSVIIGDIAIHYAGGDESKYIAPEIPEKDESEEPPVTVETSDASPAVL